MTQETSLPLLSTGTHTHTHTHTELFVAVVSAVAGIQPVRKLFPAGCVVTYIPLTEATSQDTDIFSFLINNEDLIPPAIMSLLSMQFLKNL